jgi:hypothetical protein
MRLRFASTASSCPAGQGETSSKAIGRDAWRVIIVTLKGVQGLQEFPVDAAEAAV